MIDGEEEVEYVPPTSEDLMRNADVMNLMQLWIAFSSRCNYMATIQGIVVSRQMKLWIRENTGVFHYVLSPTFRVFEISASFLDDFWIMFNAFMSYVQHMDLYSLSLFAGKCIKIAF